MVLYITPPEELPPSLPPSLLTPCGTPSRAAGRRRTLPPASPSGKSVVFLLGGFMQGKGGIIIIIIMHHSWIIHGSFMDHSWIIHASSTRHLFGASLVRAVPPSLWFHDWGQICRFCLPPYIEISSVFLIKLCFYTVSFRHRMTAMDDDDDTPPTRPAPPPRPTSFHTSARCSSTMEGSG